MVCLEVIAVNFDVKIMPHVLSFHVTTYPQRSFSGVIWFVHYCWVQLVKVQDKQQVQNIMTATRWDGCIV